MAATASAVDIESAVMLAETTSKVHCRLPPNGHREDTHHYQCCVIVSTGIVLRKKLAHWLNGIPSHPAIMKVVDFVVGSSCKQFLLKGKCSEEDCTSKHVADLNFGFPQKLHGRVFNIVNKWFLGNAIRPDFRAIFIMLSRLTEDSLDTLMIVLLYADWIPKLSNKNHSKVLTLKLIDVMVSVLGYKPWVAVRALMIFIVRPDTELSDILSLLDILELTTFPALQNHLYGCVSCLWHINDSFVCPPSLLFTIIKESLAQMPVDVKLTKDRVLIDLLKLPKPLLHKEFLTVDKFLSKYYPLNSDVVHVFRTSVWYGVDASGPTVDYDRGTYETSRVKGTGPVNPQWEYWDIQEARIKAFDAVVKNARRPRKEKKSLTGSLAHPVKENVEVDVWSHDLFKMLGSRNLLCYDRGLSSSDFGVEETNELDCLIDALVSNKLSKVVRILMSSSRSLKADAFEKCIQTLKRQLELCDRAQVSLVVFDILERLPGSISDQTSVKSCFVRTVNSIVMKFYGEEDYASALKLLKAERHAGVNCLDHAPEGVDQQKFAIVCSDIAFNCRLYTDAIRTLRYKNCLRVVDDGFDRSFPEHFYQLERLAVEMFKTFLKKRYATHALDIFSFIFSLQGNLNFPINIGRYYEGVLFLSFVTDLGKNACSPGDGANLYITVDRLCGNSQPFSSITYRSLLVELHRAESPEDVIRRVLWICITKKIYPDFTSGPVSPLVLESHLAQDEVTVYLKHFFGYFAVQNDHKRLTDRPLVVMFSESPPPAKQVFPIPNDIMKTSRTISDAMERLKAVLGGFSGELHLQFHEDSVTVPVKGLKTLLHLHQLWSSRSLG